MMKTIQLNGKDDHLYQLLAPLVMDPDVIRANNNYPFKTNDNFIWFITIDNDTVIGFIPVEKKSVKKAVINNYYISADGALRDDILSELLVHTIEISEAEGWFLESVTLTPDKETFEKFGFSSLDKKWTRYVKMHR